MQIFSVGGAVRDTLLGLPVKDRDWLVVGATPAMMQQQGYKQVGKDFPVFLHPETGEEYALARTERKTGRGHCAFAFSYDTSVSVEEDLLRRDLTVNAIARAADGTLIDPYGGCRDIAERTLRHVSPAFAEDPLRVLRLMRFWARFYPLGFHIADDTLALCKQMVARGELQDLTPERVWTECEKALQSAAPDKFFTGLAAVGALEVLGFNPPTDILQKMNAALTATTALTAIPEERFALWLQAPVCSAYREAVAEHLPLPKSYRYWLHLAGTYGDTLRNWQQAPADIRLQALKACHSLRTTGHALHLAQLMHADATVISNIQAALTALHTIDPETLSRQGLTGAALGAAIKNRQLHILQP